MQRSPSVRVRAVTGTARTPHRSLQCQIGRHRQNRTHENFQDINASTITLALALGSFSLVPSLQLSPRYARLTPRYPSVLPSGALVSCYRKEGGRVGGGAQQAHRSYAAQGENLRLAWLRRNGEGAGRGHVRDRAGTAALQ